MKIDAQSVIRIRHTRHKLHIIYTHVASTTIAGFPDETTANPPNSTIKPAKIPPNTVHERDCM